MRLLCLDTCFSSCSVALFGDQRVVAARQNLMERGHAEVLAPMIQDVLREAQVSMAEVMAIAVTIGPGTFTGLRIGLAMAQGLALPRNIPLIPISSLQATAAGLVPAGSNILVCHQAGATGQCYVQRFDRDGHPSNEPQLLSQNAIQVDPNDILIGSAAAQIAHEGLRSPAHDLPDAARFAAFAATMPRVSAGDVQPFYMREADAKLPVPPPIELQRVGSEHARVLALLHQMSFAAAWTAQDLQEMLTTPGTLVLMARAGPTPAGFLMIRAIAGEAEILTLAVDPAYRRRGIAKKLLQAGSTYLGALRSPVLHLEVSSENKAALALYHDAGFIQSGLRRGYYALGDGQTADAILMRRDIL